MAGSRDPYVDASYDVYLDEEFPHDLEPGMLITGYSGKGHGGYGHRTPKNQRITSTKGTTMALTPKQKVRKLEAELDSNLTLQQDLKKEEVLLRKDIKLADTPEPTPSMGTKWWISVQFHSGAKEYDYLVMRVGDVYYTTGTGKSAVFRTWWEFVAWLDAETIYHSAMVPLITTSGKGPLATKPPTEVPL